MSRLINKPIPPPELDAEGRPVAFTWNGQRYRVRTLVDCWNEWLWWLGDPPRVYYRVETTDAGLWDLWYDKNGWWLHRIWDLRDKGAHPGALLVSRRAGSRPGRGW